jgi:hypothetical protein
MITVILTGWRRPQVLKRQIQAINAQTIKPKEIMLWINGDGYDFDEKLFEGIKVIKCNHNFKFHGRFALALLAKTEYVCIFDDDTIPGNQWFENCLDSMRKQEGLMGTAGVFLDSTSGYTSFMSNKKGWNGLKSDNIEEVDLVGHSWFFKREWLKYFWMEEPLSWDNAEDIHFSYTLQKYGNIGTFVPPHSEDKRRWGSVMGALGCDQNASSVGDSDNHMRIRNECVKKACKNGWTLLKDRKND